MRPYIGNEGDTLQSRTIWVYDTRDFPFHPGELYQQYHSDMGVAYGRVYAELRYRNDMGVAMCVCVCVYITRDMAEERGVIGVTPMYTHTHTHA